MPRRRSKDRERYWRDVLRKQQQSGQSVRQFCLEHEITEASFYGWRRKLGWRGARPAKTTEGVTGPSGRGSEAAPFIPLHVLASAGSGEVVEVVHPRGHVVRVRASFDGESLERLLTILDRSARTQ